MIPGSLSKPPPSASRPPHRATASIRDNCTYTETIRKALIDLNEVLCADLAIEVNHHAHRIPHDRQVRKDPRRPEQRLPVTRDDLHVAKTP